MGFLNGKRALVTGLISNRSIAAGIAEALHREGAELAFTYQNDRFKERIETMAHDWGSNIAIPCDVSSDSDIENLFHHLEKSWDSFDILVHSIAYAPADQLEGDYLQNINREGFRVAHEISSYSFAALAKAGAKLMQGRRGSLITLSYLGAEQAIPNYNVMGLAKASLEANVRYMANSLGPQGIRVNAVSAGPIRTLAASGIKDFRKILEYTEKVSPLRENVTTEQVGNVCAFLASDLSQGITGEVIHVDGGFHAARMNELEFVNFE